MNAVTQASKAMLYADNRMATGYSAGLWHVAFRHGRKDPRPINADAAPWNMPGRCNFSFVDGHVESATCTMIRQTWKLDYEIPPSWVGKDKFENIFNNNKTMFRGFDPSK